MRGARATVAALFCAAAVALAGCSHSGTPRAAASSPPVTEPATASPPSASPTASTASPAPTAGDAGWLSYHADQARTASVSGSVANPAKAGWSVNLGAAVYGQPAIAGNTVVVGTESDRVVALDRTTGRTLWSYSLGSPLTNVDQRAGCGNVDPLGITSALAIDAARDEVFAVGEVAEGGSVQHRLVGLNLSSGTVELNRNVDPPLTGGQNPLHLLQRAGLAVANGRVYIGFGGNDGDCGSYHGWLVAAPETGGGAIDSFEVAPDGQGGAIWLAGGAPAIGPDGSVYVTTGNANPFPPGVDRLQYTESVVKLSPTLRVEAAYKDPTAGGDEDLATGNPVLLPGGLVFAVGKTDAGHLLRASDLTSVATISGLCGSDPDGGPAYDPATQRLFVPCRGGGIQVVEVAARRLGPKLPGANSAPIVVGGKVWAATYNGGGLTEFDAASGAVVQRQHTGALPTFASPSYADGVLFLGTRSGVETFG